MRQMSILMIAGGILLGVFGVFMDVTVETGYGRSVANIHLISQRQTLLTIAGFIFLGGVILFGFSAMSPQPAHATPNTASPLPPTKAEERQPLDIPTRVEEAPDSPLAAVHSAILADDSAAITKWLAAGNSVNSADGQGNTLLHYAVLHQNYYPASTLVVSGADLDLKNADGKTPLMIAKAKGNRHIIKLIESYQK